MWNATKYVKTADFFNPGFFKTPGPGSFLPDHPPLDGPGRRLYYWIALLISLRVNIIYTQYWIVWEHCSVTAISAAPEV